MKKNNKYLILFLLASFFSFTSCLVEDEVASDIYDQGPNLVGFEVTGTATEGSTSVVSDGQEYSATIPVNITGPGFTELEGDVLVNYSVNEELSTAVEGVHYTLPNSSITLVNDQNYMGLIPLTILTEGIGAPSSAVLVLDITEVSPTGEDVVINGRRNQLVYTINYNCFADLSGTYTMTNSVCGVSVPDVVITPNANGSWYLSTADGGLLQYCTSNTTLQNFGNIFVVCGEVQPSNDLDWCGDPYGIGCITGGAWDDATGTLTLSHTDAFFGVGSYTSTYVRN